jgi:uncharacterized protein YjbI with pentapeptide repeats
MNQQSSRRPVFRQFLSILTRKASKQVKQQAQVPQRPASGDRNAWRDYWEAQSQSWRTEPKIDTARQKSLNACFHLFPGGDQEHYPYRGKDQYPFKDVRLSRADIEWLLATYPHKDGRGSVEWFDEHSRRRKGLDLRGAMLQEVDLHDLPLVEVNLRAAHLEKANLREAHLERTNLREAHLERANLVGAYLVDAFLVRVHLENASLFRAHLEGANFTRAYLEGCNLHNIFLSHETILRDVSLSSEKTTCVDLAFVHWNDVDLTQVDWNQVKMLEAEYQARRRKTEDGEMKDTSRRLFEYQTAVRVNYQLAAVLQGQGLNEPATRFAYHAQTLQKKVLWLQMLRRRVKLRDRVHLLGAWLFSWFLFLLAGYGYKPWHSFLAYLFVISGFATAYYLLGLHDVVGSHHVFGPYHLTWYEAIVVSMTAFHGRGFFANQFQPGDPQAFVAALEAFVGLIIEVTFIATLTRRLFGQ